MSLSRDQREIIENTYLVSIFDQMEQDVIADISRRVEKTQRYTETAEILARNMRELGYSPIEIQKAVMQQIGADADLQMAIAENTSAYKKEVAEIIKQTEMDALAAGDLLTATAGDMSWNDDMQMWQEHGVDLKKDGTLSQIIDGVKDSLQGDIKNLTQSTGFIDGDLDNAYQKALDKTFIKMATGMMGYEAAAKECVLEMAKHGMVVQYASGRKYHLDTATRMCIRTATAKLSGSIMESNMQKTGQDLVYVDAHAGARPEHAVWQGKVFVYNTDVAKKYPEYGNFWDETDYGSITGLQGVNCMHNWYPYWPGDPIPDFKEPDPVEIDGKEYTYYEATQEQRRQERNIRSVKRQIDAAQALGDTDKAAALTTKLSQMYNNYGKFSMSANLRPKYERMGYGQYLTQKQRKTLGIPTDITPSTPPIDKLSLISSHVFSSEVGKRAMASGIDYRAIGIHTEQPSHDEIVARIAGGDKTKGSCASMALTYAGNVAGYDVLDYRGGMSQDFFCRRSNICGIGSLDGVQSWSVSAKSDVKASKELLKNAQDGKEYILISGAHAAVVKVTNGQPAYLELQSGTSNGYVTASVDDMAWRFGMRKSGKYELQSMLVDVESLTKSLEFGKILGYINTEESKQKKGKNGTIK